MPTKELDQILKEHPFFSGLEPRYLSLIAGCAKNVQFEPGDYLLHEGGDADQFFVIREGTVAIEVHGPGRPPVTVQTVKDGEIVGASWLLPPYRWAYDAKAIDFVRATALDAKCLRGKCEEDHELGYDLMKRFLPVVVARLHAARLQMVDVYGAHS